MLIIRGLNLISVQSLTYLVFHSDVDITGNLCYVKVVSVFVPVHSTDCTYMFQNIKINVMTTQANTSI